MVRSNSDWGSTPRGRMPVSERAKIFIPFDPLKGFSEALCAKEVEVELAMTEGDGVTRRGEGMGDDSNPDGFE